uniref:TcfC E-set like domain-containing protein n=1 Tax=Vibrio campbellii TaxID=680 RepID=UPI000A408E6E
MKLANNKKVILFAAANMLYSLVCLASDTFFIPQGFEDFYTAQEVQITLILSADKKKKIELNALVTGDFVVVDTSEYDTVEKFLIERFGVDSVLSKKIGDELVAGVKSSQLCIGYRGECGLIPDKFDFVYVPEQQQLILHVNSDYLIDVEKRKSVEYIEENIAESAIILNHSLNVSLNSQAHSDNVVTSKASYQNITYAGISERGDFIYSDVALDSDNGFSGREISYNLLKEDIKFAAGYQYNNDGWNNTSFLTDHSVSGYMLQVGSTDELKKDKSSNRRIYFNVPKSGRLEVTDDLGRYLISENIDMGQAFISYKDLPKGSYAINVRVYDGSGDIFTQNYQI